MARQNIPCSLAFPSLGSLLLRLLLPLLLASHTALPAEDQKSWFAREWQSEDGLPENRVTGVVQAADGFLWVATQHALTRFDGIQFRPVPLPDLPAAPQRSFHSLLRGGNGEIWAAMENGIVLALSNTSTNLFTVASGLPTARPNAMAQDASGALWIGYADGSACRISGGRVQSFDHRHGLAGSGQCWVAADPDGLLYYAKTGWIGVFRDGQFVPLREFPNAAIRICAARDGGIWIAAGLQLWKFRDTLSARPLATLNPTRRTATPRVLREDRSGALWIGTSDGLFRYDPAGVTPVRTSHQEITDLAEDREGNIWAATDGGGLNRLRPRVVSFLSTASGLPFETTRSLCQDTNGNIWAISQTGIPWRRIQGQWQMFPERTAWQGRQAACLAADPHGGVWIGTAGAGLFYWDGQKISSPATPPDLPANTIRSLLLATNGDLWVGLESGDAVLRLRDGQFTSFPLPANRPVRAMAEDSTGNIWMGTASGQIFCADAHQVREQPQPFPVPWPIRCLYATPDGSVYIGYAGAGIGRFKHGTFSCVAADQGLHDPFVSSISADDYGSFWIGADRGVFEVRQRELESVLDGRLDRLRSLVYGRDEGLPSLQANFGFWPAHLRTAAHRLWLPMRTGLALVSPDPVRASHVPPPVVIERFLLDGRPIQPPFTPGHLADSQQPAPKPLLRLPPRHRRLEIEFTALSFVAPDNVHFRYRLDGIDDAWSDPTRARTVSYARLPAGDYQFLLTACNSAGVWNPGSASVRFRVQPFFYQTWWFRLALLAAFTGAVIGLVRYSSFRTLRRKLLRLEKEAAVHTERARIAKDIHDDLGASLTQIALLGELARQDLNSPGQTAAHLGKIADTARHGTKSLEEIVWAANPRNDTLSHLLDFVGQFAVDFLRPAGIRCRIDFPDNPPSRTVPADVRHNLFLAAKEALHNTAKHAHATEVRLRAELSDSLLRLTIEDNGRGFDRPPDHAGADGLRNMRQRLADIHGTFDIHTRPNSGTRITLQVPCPSHPR